MESGLKLEYRSGYYAARDFAHSTKGDREQQLQDQLFSDLSSTDLGAYVATAFFRLADARYYVPLTVAVPGYQIPITKATDKSKATIDVLGIVRDRQNRPVGRIRDTIRLAPEAADDLKRKTVQYETGFQLPPGTYHVKMVVRENQDGAVGSYETDFVVPDVGRDALQLSSVVVGTQLQTVSRRNDRNPLIKDDRELVPNVTHVVSSGQHLYFYYEVYEPAQPVKVLTSIAFFRGKQRLFETPLVETTELAAADRKTAVFQFDVPASSLQPGLYTCQINVVDDTSGSFSFPRLQLYVRR
jgi:hypothetical protein